MLTGLMEALELIVGRIAKVDELVPEAIFQLGEIENWAKLFALVVVAKRKLPTASVLNLSIPLVAKARLFAVGLNKPVSPSPVNLKARLATVLSVESNCIGILACIYKPNVL